MQALRDAGLTVHEIEYGEGQSKVLGWSIDEKGTVGPTLSRLWRVRQGIREILRRGRASGQQLERLVGHMTFISLCRRESLSVLGDIYTLIKRHYSTVVPLWKSVRRELAIWDGVSPLIHVNMKTPWKETLYAVDAADWGMGVTTSTVRQPEAAEMGRHVERWRFRDVQARNPRLYVHADDKVFGLDVGEGAINGSTDSSVRFPTVGFHVVDRQWLRPDSMPVYEARATQYAVRHALRDTSNFGKRFIILTDSMTAAVSFDKGRAQSFRLRRVLQQTIHNQLGISVTWERQAKKRGRSQSVQPNSRKRHLATLAPETMPLT